MMISEKKKKKKKKCEVAISLKSKEHQSGLKDKQQSLVIDSPNLDDLSH